jgi:Leucine-rich repeat (LRR) protein
VSTLTHLEALNIAGNLLTDLPYSMTGMPLLTSCNMEFNQCLNVSDTIHYLKNIFSIDLIGNPIVTIDAFGNAIDEYSPIKSRDDNLDRKLFFIQNRYWKNGLVIGFDSVEELLSLGWTNKAHYGLDLYNAGLRSLRGISHIPDIGSYDVLYAHNNTFTEIPAEIAAMTNLRVIHVENNDIQAIDPALSNLVALREMYARNNSLTDIPAGIYQAPEIRILDLSLNLCVTLTDALYTMTNLKKLFLNSNEITSMPSNIDKLSRLTELQINDNWLTTLPRGIGKMNNLSYLHIENNEFESIPAPFAANAQIFCVNARKNKFTSLPSEIMSNTCIAYLNIDFSTTNTLLEETLNRLNPNRQYHQSIISTETSGA